MGDSERRIEIQWNSRLEEYFAHTAEKAHCLSWLHGQCEDLYSRRTIWIDLPVIILGTLNGAISVGSDALFGTAQYASVGVGVVALITAIMTTIGSYFAWAKRSEAHRISALSYGKLYRFLSVEMSLPRHERMTPTDLLKYVKVEYDRLSEISPLVPPLIVNLFRAKFSGDNYKDISKPEITNGLHAVEVYRDPHALKSFKRQSLKELTPESPAFPVNTIKQLDVGIMIKPLEDSHKDGTKVVGDGSGESR